MNDLSYSFFIFQGQEGGYGSNFAGCPTLPRHPHHGHHIVESNLTNHPHPSQTMEWPSYQGAVGISRRQHIVATQTPPPHQSGPGCSASSRLTSFRPSGVPTQTMTYEMPLPPPLHQIPVLDEESADLTEMPLISADKIESTV